MSVSIVLSYTQFYNEDPNIEGVFSKHDKAWEWIQDRLKSGITYTIEDYEVKE